MIKTQIQIPDHLFREAKRIAAEYEMSFADVVRRGLEGIVPAFPPRKGLAADWRLPRLNLGLLADPFANPDWRAALYVSSATIHEPPAPKRSPKRRKSR